MILFYYVISYNSLIRLRQNFEERYKFRARYICGMINVLQLSIEKHSCHY